MVVESDRTCFSFVEGQEYRHVRARRAGTSAEAEPTTRPDDLFGIALSGGGQRSASFCLGALQALHACGLVTRADYLSTVSGGGYIGAGMIAGMARENGAFPYAPVRTSGDSDYVDSDAVSHLRDNGNYIAPGGRMGLLIPLAALIRGWLVNAIIVLALLLPLATLTILANPTSDHLGHSVVYDLTRRFGIGEAGGWLEGSYLLTKALLVAGAVFFVGWALVRSGAETAADKRAAKGDPRLAIPVDTEIDGRGMRFATLALLVLVAVVLIESQDHVLRFLIDTFLATSTPNTVFVASWVTLSAFLGIVATVRRRLADWIEKAFHNTGVMAWVKAIAARALLVLVGLLLPVLIYGIYLVLCLWGIQVVGHAPPDIVSPPLGLPYPLAPPLLQAYPGEILAVLALSVVPALALLLMDVPWAQLRGLWAWRRTCIGALAFVAVAALAALATWDPSAAQMRGIFVAASLLAIFLAAAFTENANAFHRFYKERLAAAYDLMLDDRSDPRAFMPMDDARLLGQPYLLVNATLNVRRAGNGSTAKEPSRRLDPARRGRNAEFFLFSPCHVGSDVTGYAETAAYAVREPVLDLPAAVAISGAAVSSSMGRIGIGLLGPTLALLNLRLGCWLLNPTLLNRPRDTAWEDFLRSYLLKEAFGRLSASASRIYVTDGGHIDNIGLYQLLKRRCAFIVVVDAEADPALHFSALADVERFARIDLGCRIEIDTAPIRATVDRTAEAGALPPGRDGGFGGHAAIGRIDYGLGHPEGVLLYVKATTTGDESSYVLDYKRRYPTFPHETTGDQFFSEEQMEAYRALGFHSIKHAFATCRRPRDMTGRAAWERRKAMMDALQATAI